MKTILILAAALTLGASDDKKKIDVVCPLDGAKFKAIRVIQTNQWGGVDWDFCPHAFKTTPLEYFVWVCPSCHFAGLRKDFSAPLDDDKKEMIRGKLSPVEPVKRSARQTDIPGHIKYDLLAQVRTLTQQSDDEIAKAYLYASWSCRQQGAVYLHYFDEWEKVRTKYGFNRKPLDIGIDKQTKKMKNRTEFDFECLAKLEKEIVANKMWCAGVNRRLAGELGRYLCAYIYRKHGEYDGALKWLKELEAYKGENSIVDDAVEKMKASIECEKKFQAKALDVYLGALKRTDLPATARSEITYLAGELYRRLGKPQEAAKWYQKALDLSPTPAIKKLATQQQPKVNVTPTEKK